MGLSVDEWTLVIRNGKKGHRLKSFHATSRCKAILDSTRHLNNEYKISFFDLATHVTKFKNNFPEHFKQFVISRLEKALFGHHLSVIRIFGIGSISTSHDSLWQLVLLLLIKEHFCVDLVTSQDPLTSNTEDRYLQSCGIKVLAPDDLKSTPPSTSSDAFTLLYMIHCTQDMYENVISYYSSKANDDIQRIILIGNDPENLSTATINFKLQIPYLISFTALSRAVPLPYFDPKENAFHGTAICFIKINEEDDEK